MVDTDADSLVGALEVRKQVLRGFSLAALLAVGAYVFFVVAPGSPDGAANATANATGGTAPAAAEPFYLVLLFVLAVSGGMLLTVVFALVEAYRLSRRTE